MKTKNFFIINVDFDGSVVTHAYPKVGKDIGSARVLKRIIANGHKLILNTMRSEINYIDDAVNWFKENKIELYDINKNKDQYVWTNSPKPYSNMIIDDSALGCPLKYDETISDRPFVDWIQVEFMLEEMGLLRK
jgi:hypothetical protein